ncbi:methyl-accepting chemotaxis protein [Paenibacillus sp. DYY-L-2]|uniref:methyl-accepting chemotaxis protein n=1 Tax=Paenibacillus sp. DYY-L-2 TaxID=3447013 RepID=UPI003F50BCA3
MHNSLKGKILRLITVLIAACAISFTALSYFEIQRSVTSQMKSDGTTLVSNIKRDIINNEIVDLQAMQNIFKTIKEDSNGNIVYISLSDTESNLIVSDNHMLEQLGDDAKNDATSAASASGDVSKVVERQETVGTLLETAEGQKVYNVSTDFTYNAELSGVLNVGISLDNMHGVIRSSLIWTVTVSLVILAVALIIGAIAARKMIHPLTMMTGRIQEFADGDFTKEVRYQSRDEIGAMSTSLAHMRLTLGGMVKDIQQNSKKVATSAQTLSNIIDETTASATEISRATDELANGAGGLANGAQDGLEKLNRLADEIMKLNGRAEVMKASIDQTKSASLTGMNCIGELQKAMNENAGITSKIEEQVDELGVKSELITEITAVIRAVSDQTHLLALNAMIESARAGEHGRGFAVVAEQIRKLSEQTASSVQGIEETVHQVNAAISKTQDFMEQGTQVARRTARVSEETGQAFELIARSVSEFIRAIEELIGGISQLDSDKNGVIAAMESISSIAQESSASTEEILAATEEQLAGMDQVAHAAEELKNIAKSLEQLIDRFRF